MDCNRYPVLNHLNDLRAALADSNRAILVGPPGSGKTTLLPQELLQESWLGNRKILMLAPRRLAARSGAMRIASLLGEEVGQTVGYRVRGDSRIGRRTRIELLTEGIFTRKLQNDPGLEDVGLVIFDEFHERSLESDLCLAFCLDLQSALTPQLRLLVMSATLDVEPLAAMLDSPPVIHCRGSHYPVTVEYRGQQAGTADPSLIVRVIREVVTEGCGSILVFLPGAGEIRRLHRLLAASRETADSWLGPEWELHPLYAKLTREEQHRAISPSPPGKKKIVLATNIAETSLTIEGIELVIDSGLEKRLLHDPTRSMSRLVTRSISRSSADQRKGRAGRTGPGRCIRLWSKEYDRGLRRSRTPEIREADLSSLVLELSLWGVREPAQLNWLDPPPAPGYEGAKRQLTILGALDQEGRITTRGRQLAELPLHPRLGHMVLTGAKHGCLQLACDLAVLLSERDPLCFPETPPLADLQLRLDLLESHRNRKPFHCYGATVDSGNVRHLVKTSAELYRRLKQRETPTDSPPSPGLLVACGYPDRIGRRRQPASGRSPAGHYHLSSGRGGILSPDDPLSRKEWLVAPNLEGTAANSRIFLAISITEPELRSWFKQEIKITERVEWDDHSQKVVAREATQLFGLTLTSRPLPLVQSPEVTAILLDAIRAKGINNLPWNNPEGLIRLRQRLQFLHNQRPSDWPDFSDETVMAELDTWLAPWLTSATSLGDLSGIDLKAALLSRIDQPCHSLHRQLEDLAPSHFTVPSGSRIPIDYSSDPPILSVRVQEMFGCRQHPAIMGGRVPLQLHLLSPARRPLQITSDLAGFWENSYPLVQKEMKGRYPKHPWPDNPLQAIPTNRTKHRC